MLRSTITSVLVLILSSCMREAVNLMGDQPRDLTECFRLIDSSLGLEKISRVRAMTEEEFAGRGSEGLARWIRTSWWLWSEGELNRTFQALGVTEPGRMSEILLRSYYRYLQNRPLEIEDQIERSKASWRQLNLQRLVNYDSVALSK